MTDKGFNLITVLPDVRISGAQPETFQCKGGFMELGHFNKYFVKNKRKKRPAWKSFKFFLLDTLRPTFWMKKLTQGWTQSGHFFQNHFTFLIFKKKDRGVFPFLCTSASVPWGRTITSSSWEDSKMYLLGSIANSQKVLL